MDVTELAEVVALVVALPLTVLDRWRNLGSVVSTTIGDAGLELEISIGTSSASAWLFVRSAACFATAANMPTSSSCLFSSNSTFSSGGGILSADEAMSISL